jgi:hypothetical protein
LKTIVLCGNYGDPIANIDIIPILKYILNINPKIKIDLYTNGGARNVEFWKEIAHLVQKVHFAIDGLEDTNHLYRQFVNWNILKRNVQAYIAESSKLKKRNHSHWVMNVFKHNEHQIDDAKKTAKLWGISVFRERYTARFVKINSNKIGLLHDWPVYNDDGSLKHTIYPTTKNHPENFSENYEHIQVNNIPYEGENVNKITQKILDDYNSVYQNSDIECKSNTHKSLYIDYRGKLFPCCWFGDSMQRPITVDDIQIKQMYEKYGNNFNDLSKYSIESIFDSGIFEEIEIGMQHKNISCGKTIVCMRRCSKKSLNHKFVATDL